MYGQIHDSTFQGGARPRCTDSSRREIDPISSAPVLLLVVVGTLAAMLFFGTLRSSDPHAGFDRSDWSWKTARR